jgi:caffeoyl-CoA O-methyltransferase
MRVALDCSSALIVENLNMSRETIDLTPPLATYLRSVGTRETDLLRELRQETSLLSDAGMQISVEQGQLLRFLVRTTGARRALEVGVFTGYSGLCVAMELPEDGRWIGCDTNPETTAVAKRYFERAGLLSKFDVRLGPGVATLEKLAQDGERFDFIFVDADKESYPRYYELALELLRPRGIAAFDNVLWGGAVADPAQRDAATSAIRSLNAQVAVDPRVSMSMIPIGDGLTLVSKT